MMIVGKHAKADPLVPDHHDIQIFIPFIADGWQLILRESRHPFNEGQTFSFGLEDARAKEDFRHPPFTDLIDHGQRKNQ